MPSSARFVLPYIQHTHVEWHNAHVKHQFCIISPYRPTYSKANSQVDNETTDILERELS